MDSKMIIYKTNKRNYKKSDLEFALRRIRLKDKYVKHIMSYTKEYLFDNLLNSYVTHRPYSFMSNVTDFKNINPVVYTRRPQYTMYCVTINEIKRFIKENPLKD